MKRLDGIGITFKGSGSYLPQQVLSNNDLSRIVDTSDDWIKTRTGISNRRISKSEEDVSYMGHKAAYRLP